MSFSDHRNFAVGTLLKVIKGDFSVYSDLICQNQAGFLRVGDTLVIIENYDPNQVLFKAISKYGVVFFDRTYTLWMVEA